MSGSSIPIRSPAPVFVNTEPVPPLMIAIAARIAPVWTRVFLPCLPPFLLRRSRVVSARGAHDLPSGSTSESNLFRVRRRSRAPTSSTMTGTDSVAWIVCNLLRRRSAPRTNCVSTGLDRAAVQRPLDPVTLTHVPAVDPRPDHGDETLAECGQKAILLRGVGLQQSKTLVLDVGVGDNRR